MKKTSNTPFETVALVANGEISNYDVIKQSLKDYHKIIAVDGGLAHCNQMEIIPHFIIGDFDSAPKLLLEKFHNIPQERYPIDKDQSDLELAIATVDLLKVKSITLFGALGKRMDHSLYNMQLMCRYPGKIFIQSESEKMVAVQGIATIETYPKQTLSLIPMSSEKVIATTKGLKWELNHATLSNNFISLSNICIHDSFEINVENGILICSLISPSLFH